MADGPAGFPPGSSCPVVLGDSAQVGFDFGYRSFTFFGRAFQPFPLSPPVPSLHAPQPHKHRCLWFGLFQVRSPLLPESLVCFLFLRVLRCFNSPRSLARSYVFTSPSPIAGWGFPIRISPDQSLFGSSPRLFAAVHVLHRFLMPRHPPCALTSLIKQSPHSSSLFSLYYEVFKNLPNASFSWWTRGGSNS